MKRHPKLHAGRRKPKTRWKDSHHLASHTINHDDPAQNAGITAEFSHPQRMTQDYKAILTGLVFPGGKVRPSSVPTPNRENASADQLCPPAEQPRPGRIESPAPHRRKGADGHSAAPVLRPKCVQMFLAHRGGEVRGRIAAILNQGHIAHYNDRRGFFGFFDCCDDQEAAHGLFDAVRRWFADQDIHRLRGPTNPSLNYELGLLIDGFDSPPTFMMTYNPPYYERLVESYGFRKTQDLYAFWGDLEMLPKIAKSSRPSPNRSSSDTTSNSARWTPRGFGKTWRCFSRSTTARW